MTRSDQDLIDQYRRFVRFVKTERVVWGLESEDGWATAASGTHADRTVMLFWSHKTYARRMANDEWTDSRPMPINLDKFVNRWLKGMQEDGYLVGLNWHSDQLGQEVEPTILFKDLNT